jgi:undecaprenyl-diphosphatase
MDSSILRSETSNKQSRPEWPLLAVWPGLLVSALALLGFFGIVDIVFKQRPLLRVDAIVAEYLLQRTTPLGIKLMQGFSALAVPGALVLSIAGALLLAYRRRWADLTLWAVALSGGFFLNWWLKQVYDAIRPPIADPLHLAYDWGFPSGHALAALIVYGLIGVLIWPRVRQPFWRNTLMLALVALILVIGFSRLYVRDHYLGDVLAGYAVGLSWLALCIGVWAAYRRSRN